MNLFNIVFDFALNPAREINKIMQERRLGLALLGYFTGALSLMMMLALENGGAKPAVFTAGAAGFLFFNLCAGFFFASSAHLFLEITTGKGRAAGLFVLIGLSEFTKTLLAAFALCAAAVPQLAALRAAIVIAVLILQLFVILFMMHHAYGLSKTGTFFALAASLIPSVVSLLTLGVLFIGFIFWMIFR
ncbi:MAG: hypothetical protein LBL61_00585 [Elusimicrobiota bacterium]|jgi:hypothetical protein|nr:hypothetical protein [Elusimicrobiota bacterium]